MPHTHDRLQSGDVTGRRLGWSVLLTVAFVVGEATAGYWANSLALLADAGHNFADALALALSWYTRRLSRRPADPRRTYGYHRAAILAALANAVSLVVLAFAIGWEAASRLLHPEPVSGGLMAGVALAAVVLNGVISLWLRAGSRNDLNVRSAYLHMLGDAVSSVGVVVAGLIVAMTGWAAADPVVSFLIAGLILWSSRGIVAESVDVLLEAAPAGLDTVALGRAVGEITGIRGVHDLHVWTVGPGIIACSCHILVGEQTIREGQQFIRAVVALLKADFGVSHTTVQVEVEGCDPDSLYCTLRPATDPDVHGHEPPRAAGRGEGA